MKVLERAIAMLQSIRARMLLFFLALTIVISGTFAYLGVDAIRQAGHSAEKTGSATLRAQAQEYLVQLTRANADKNDLILQRVKHDAENIAAYAADILDNPNAVANSSYWVLEEHMQVGPDGQFANGPADVTSVFVPNFVERDEQRLAIIAASAYLDFVLPSIYESDPNSVAVYLGTEEEITRYYPNIDLGNVLPPDFEITQRPWYVSAAPEQNPQHKTTWSEVYEDATGQGLLVTAAAPVMAASGEFLGVVGIDVSLASLRDNIEKTTFASGGYLFMVDQDARAIALPENGYHDLLGRAPEEGEVGTALDTAAPEFVSRVLNPMLGGQTGFTTLTQDGRELFVAYAPLRSTGWSIGSVVEAEQMLAAISTMRADIEHSTNALISDRVLPTAIVILGIVGVIGLYTSGRLASPIQQLAKAAQHIGSRDLDYMTPESGALEINILSDAMRDANQQLRELIGTLEQRVAERTQALEMRARQLEAAADVAHAAAELLDPQILLSRVVSLISERFDFYHAGIFLLDESREYAELRAASSPGGQRMLARHHRLRKGQEGIVGYVTHTGEPRIALDVGQDAVFFDNPDLPETRSELALPLRVRGQIIGALDVQSTQETAFTQEDVSVLQTLADQVALAISNAEYRREAEERLVELQRAYGMQSRQAWLDAARLGQVMGYRYTNQITVPAPDIWYPEMERVLREGQPVQQVIADDPENGQRAVLTVPVKIHGETIGVLDIRKPAGSTEWADEETEIVTTIAEQLGRALETAQLYQNTQRAAAREHLISEVTSRMRETLDFEAILRTAVDEIYQTLELDELEIYLAPEAPDNGAASLQTPDNGK